MPRYSTDRRDDRLRLRFCVAATALEFGAEDLCLEVPRARGPLIDLARQVAMSLAHNVLGMSHTRIGALMQRDRSTVAHGCEVVEDERDDPIFAGKVGRLERALLRHVDGLATGETVQGCDTSLAEAPSDEGPSA